MALERLPPPGRLDFNSKSGINLADDWKKWKEEFTLFAELALKDSAEIEKLKMFKYLIGPEGREIYATQTWEKEEKDRTLKVVIETFDAYCEPKKNETVERFKFNMRVQGDETLEKFITDVKTLAQSCNFGTLTDSLVRDKLVCGVKDSHLRERLLRTPDLTLDKAVELARAAEITKQSVNTLDGAAASVVHKVKRHTPKKPPVVNKDREVRKGPSHKPPTPKQHPKECLFCGRTHVLKKEICPAYGKICTKCGEPNHFQAKCENLWKARNPSQRPSTKRVNAVRDEDYYGEEDYYELLVIQEETCNSVTSSGEIFAALDVGDSRVNFQVDSGATCNIIPENLVPTQAEMKPTKSILKMFNKTTVTPMGKCELEIHNPKNGAVHTADFVVLKEKCTPLIGNSLMQDMDLVTINHENILKVENVSKLLTSSDITTEYADVFEGTGKFEGKYHLTLDPDATPVVHPPRKVPIALKDRLKVELDKLENMEIIAPVTEPTPWVSSMVTVVKPEKLRICIDPSDLNKGLKRSHYPLPTIEDILPSLHNAKVFSVLDARNGFWHVELDKESSLLTTFNTPYGRYRWLRMPNGISTAPEEYQRRQDQAVEGLPGVYSIVDDLLVFGEGETEDEANADHDMKLRGLLERCREKGLKLNKEKLRLRQKEVRFVGHLITADGLKPDPEKVRAVVDMPEPTDVAGVRRFIGFVTYLSKFLPGLSDKCEPLRKLTQKDVEWCWLDTHSNAVREIKELVSSQPVLRYFDPKEEVTLQCDASEKGLGAALLQKGQPVAFASRALTDVETRYAQIEKELLAVVYGLEKFHHYTYGRHVSVQSDHKPLEMIVKKPLLSAPKRLQRMLLRLQRYTFSVTHHPGKLMYLADTLSRAFLTDSQSEAPELNVSDYETINMAQDVPISDVRLEDIRRETAKDQTLQVLQDTILTGWPEKYSMTAREARPYFHVRDELVVQNGIIFRGDRAVIPMSLRADIRSRIHASHIGIEGCLRRARETIYWPNMNAEIREYISQCEVCRTYGSEQRKETLMSHEVPTQPWSKVGCDLFTIHEKDYLITVDYYSNYWEVDHLPDTKSSTVIRMLRSQFARHGIPNTVVSDNGPQYSSEEFRRFAREWGFDHVTSSPGYPQSNGKAEQAVKTAKRLMHLAKVSKTDPYLAILDFRNTPTQSMDSSPAQRLMGRRTRTMLPTKTNLLKPKIPKSVPQQLEATKERQALYYNRSARDMKPLKSGDVVRIAPTQGKQWRRGTVQQELSPRSYNVQTDAGGILRRNRRQLRKTPEIVQERECENDVPVTDKMTASPSKCDETPPVSSNETVGNPCENTPRAPVTVSRFGRNVYRPVKLDL